MNVDLDMTMIDCQLFKVRLLWEFIDKILHLTNSQVKGLNYIPTTNTIHLGKDNNLHLCFQRKYHNELWDDFFRVLPELQLQNGDDTFIIPKGYAVYDGDLEVSLDKIQNFDIKINRIDYGSVEEKSNHYWRYVYPIKSKAWFLQIESLIYKDDNGRITNFSYLKPVLGNDEMHIFVTREKDEHYMVIQSGSKMDSEEMYKRVFAITTSIGLITGYKYGDYHFQIASDEKDFGTIRSIIFGSIEKTRYCNYRIVNSKWVDTYNILGQYEYQKYAQEIVKDSADDPQMFYNNKEVEAKVFYDVVNLLYNHNDLAIAASMLLEGSLLNIIYQPPFFHIALETITSALIDNTQEVIKPPLENKEYNSKVKPILINALNDISGLPDDAKRIYTRRVENSLNSCANQDKLSKCFENVGYTLTKEDKEAIKKRNSTLHGHLSDIKRELPDQQWDMFAIALRLHKLCCILLLKAAGYKGRILNNEVIFGVKEACERKEPPYIEI